VNRHFEKFRSFIHKIVPFLSEEDITAFSSKAQKTEFKKGELFIKESEVCRHLIFIHQGIFRYYLLYEGQDFTKDFAIDTQNPFCTAYTSFMLQKPSEIWIEALETCQVWLWNQSDVLPLFQENLNWLRFSKRIADQLFYRKEQKEIELLKCSAEERYQHFLIDFPGLSQRIPQYHIATYLGITPESLSRIRSKIS
jgi:CRP-like cAMP-binding protein